MSLADDKARPRPAMVCIGGIELDRASGGVVREGRNLRLSPAEFRLLEQLMLRPGRTLTREELLATVWLGSQVDVRTVDVTIGRLRKAIRRGNMPDPIRTVRNNGYAFKDNFDAAHQAWLEGAARKKIRLKYPV